MIELLPVSSADIDAFLALNNQAVPNVNTLDAPALKALLGQAWWCRQIVEDGEMRAFLLSLRPGEDYDSDNYRWFSRRYDQFVYVDRIVVREGSRGQGLGALLYAALIEVTVSAGVSRLCCEVNLDPPNPGSSAFHQRLGFTSVGQQDTKGGRVRVDLLVKEMA